MDEASKTYYQQLKGSPAVEYLKMRGLSGDSARSARLGYVGSPLPGHEKYQGMLCIPYLTQAGPVTMKFRRIDLDPDNPSEGPKYRCLPGDPPRPYNVSALLDPTDVICVTEGEVDALTAEQAFRETGSGLRAVGMPGVSSWRPTFGRLFRGYSVVFGLADADDKGQGSDFMEKLSEEIENFRVVTMPAGHDVNSYVNEAGPQALVDRLEVR